MRLIYLILICFAAPVAAFIAWLRGLRDPARRERLADRFGRPQLAVTRPVLWVHAASMGEVQAGAVLIRSLLSGYPDYAIVVTTMTVTGAERVRALFPHGVSHCYLPYDLPFAVRGFLDRIQPQQAIVMETELWPNLLNECRRRHIPTLIASARISPRTAHRYRRLASLFRRALADGVVVAAQSSADAERFTALGAVDARVLGNIKFDFDVTDAVRATGAALRRQMGERIVWVAASTHEGEEIAALDAHRSLLDACLDALLVLVPRHPQRFASVRELLSTSGLRFGTRSASGAVTAETQVLLVDTMGELLNFYAAADFAFVGGSLVPVGGHNVLEPAALGVATVCGPFMSSAQDVADRFLAADALYQVKSPQELRDAVVQLAMNAERRAQLAAKARAVLASNRGSVQRLLDVIDAMQSSS